MRWSRLVLALGLLAAGGLVGLSSLGPNVIATPFLTVIPTAEEVSDMREGGKPYRDPRLGSALYKLVQAHQAGKLDEKAKRTGVQLHGDMVLVAIRARPGQVNAASAAVKAARGQVKGTYRDYLEAFVPVPELVSLAQHEAILRVDLPARPAPAGGS